MSMNGPTRASDNPQYDPNHFFNARPSTKHSTITTLNDISLIAFEIEHERNRLREELQRLQSAQDDAQRSLEILEFMSSRMDNDPLVNPSNNNNNYSRTINNNTCDKPTFNNNNNNNNESDNDLPPMLEYLPSNTIIRCANKQVRQIAKIKIGDKILSLCINIYPNGKSRSSYLPRPKPNKRPSQVTFNSNSNSNSHSNGHTTHTNGITKKRERSRTTVNKHIPFMLPPPVQRASQSLGKLPRKSMPAMPAINKSQSPSLIAQSVTQPANDALMLTPNGSKSPKIRRKTVGNIRNIHYANEQKDEFEISPFDIDHFNKQRQSYSNSGVTQIPGPMPYNNHNNHNNHNNNNKKTRFSTNSINNHHHNHNHNHNHIHNKSKHSSLPKYNTSKSQHNSPQNTYNKNKHFTYGQHAKSQGNIAKNRNQNHNHNHNHNHNNHKQTRFSTNNINLQKRKYQNQNQNQKNHKSNYLESVNVEKIIQTKIYKLIEIVTENDFKIRCTPTHLFWLVGKGWGCFDSKRRMFMEKQAAIMSKQNNDKNVRIPHIIHELREGEQLLSVGGNKYTISYINSIDRPNGINVYGIIVNKNDCFFANDLLVRNSIL